MKYLLPIIFVCFGLEIKSQPGLYRRLIQTQSTYFTSDIQDPQKTSDGGYLFSFYPWMFNLHGPGPYDKYTIKTDSNFIPQWRKYGDKKAIVLPTGCIITYFSYPLSPHVGTIIEKSTQAGVQLWVRQTPGSCIIADGISYNNKVRFVGGQLNPVMGLPLMSYNLPYSLEIDTLGNLISSNTYTAIGISDCSFNRIERDPLGNFLLLGSNFSIAKFGPGFNFIWGKSYSSGFQVVSFRDVEILPTGGTFATVLVQGLSTLLRFDSQGSILNQKVFAQRNNITGLSKKNNGNYVVSATRSDSLFLFETDTSMNINWYKYIGRGRNVGTSIVKGNVIYTPTFQGSEPVIISNDLSGNSCLSYSLGYVLSTPTITSSNFNVLIVSSQTLNSTALGNAVISQPYRDSCACAVFNAINQNNLCIGNTSTISVAGTGNLSWYSTVAGNSFIHSGPHFVYSSNTPTVKTLYVQDSACGANPNRTQINITVYGMPTLTLNPQNSTVCLGSQIIISAIGANSYTWSNDNNTGPFAYLSPTSTTVYTVTGINAPGCSDTKTIAIVVTPLPTLSISGPSVICAGETVTISASGALTYTWVFPGSTSQQSPSFTLSPAWPGQFVYKVWGADAFCTASAQTTVLVLTTPTLSVWANPPGICLGRPSTLTVSGATTYTWNGVPQLASIVVSPVSDKTYTVFGKNGNSCASDQTITLAVFPEPTLSAVASASSVCEGSQVTLSVSGATSYTWNNGATLNTFTISAPLGHSIYTLTGANGACTRTTSVSIQAFANPTISFVNTPTIFCEGKSTTITALGAGSYTWNGITTQNSIVVTPLSNMIFTLQGANGACVKRDTIYITVNPNPTLVAAISDPDICLGESVTILAAGAVFYTWNTGANMNIIYQSPPTTTNYIVTGTNLQGCSDTKTMTITVHSFPVITLSSSNSTICAGESATLTAFGANSYTWNSVAGNTSIAISPSLSSTFTIVASDQYGCSASATITQYVDVCAGLSNAFLDQNWVSIYPNPNQGYFNLNIGSVGGQSFMELYNSVGQSIFTKKAIDELTFVDAKDLAPGVYFLKIRQENRTAVFKIIRE